MTTQNCAECDTRAEPGQSFCDACGAVLRWDAAGARSGAPGGASAAASGSGSATGTGPAVGSGAAPGPGSHSGSVAGSAPAPGWDAFSRPGGTGLGTTGAPRTAFAPEPSPASPDLTDTTPNTPVHPAPDDFPPTTPAPPDAPNAPNSFNSPPAPAPSAPPVPDDRARSLLVPVADPDPTPPAPSPAVAPVLPGRPDAARPQVRAPGHQHRAGQGPPCPWCAAPNRPDRHFCGHCAMRLADDGVRTNTPVRLPWWRRLFGPGQHEAPWAGDRPRLRRVFDRVGTWVTAVVVVTLLILGAVYIPDGYQATRDHFAKRAPVEPDRIRASRSYQGHGPKLAFDKLNNTWWGPGVAQSGQGEWIEVGFARPTRLLDLIITPGVSTRADQLDKSALPHRVKATITKKDGSTATRDLTLDPGAGGQRRAFRVGEVTKVRFTIMSAHAASAKKQVAISEIEMFGRSDGSRT
ncbi:NADase-type glycan-binding domain-containing protein [Streptomyces flavofungini]|uniref:Zinc ribbon domain-containing protein n=1 Tax=Streptomyces flavofungini TaxID=68200 RepID=A0ABS0X8W8_9ACTN|nr:zinc ribbon domain-containing protein [Streptomyces flavofungini]MBJ3809653.1 zinc ribbon domain-containing protein [Streptomyces flavofungini]GHC56036.1 zinc ribbon domain-containing protein [Streptomyces flavofungini]